ncbi:MAG TPA: outer membrane protein transport protein [Longimicrobiaceae bacterium]
MRRSLVVAGAALALTAASAHAQGSAVMTHSSCATAMGASGVARPCEDGSAVLFNPAAIAQHPSVIGVGWTGIRTGGSFTYDITGEEIVREKETASVPFGFASFRLGQRFAAGIGAFNPYGLTIDWPVCPVGDPRCGGTNFEGRFVSYRTQLKNIYVQPTVAFQATDWLSVGAGLDVVMASIDINQRADLANLAVPGQAFTFGNLGIPSGTDFADIGLSGDGTGVTFNLGATARVNDRVSLGVRYMHSTEVDYDGTADFTPVATGLVLPAGNPLSGPAGQPVDVLLAGQFASGALVDGDISTTITLPAQLVLGVAFRPLDRLTLLADYQWTSWEDFDQATIDFANAASPDQVLILDYQNANTFRFGGELGATDALALRAGFIFNTAAEKAASVSPLLPEAERNYYSAGIGYRLPAGLGIDLGYQYIDQADRRGRVRGRTSLSQTPQQLNVGVYHADASVFNVTLSYRFGGSR